MGAYGHSRLTEFIFGGATRFVLVAAQPPRADVALKDIPDAEENQAGTRPRQANSRKALALTAMNSPPPNGEGKIDPGNGTGCVTVAGSAVFAPAKPTTSAT